MPVLNQLPVLFAVVFVFWWMGQVSCNLGCDSIMNCRPAKLAPSGWTQSAVLSRPDLPPDLCLQLQYCTKWSKHDGFLSPVDLRFGPADDQTRLQRRRKTSSLVSTGARDLADRPPEACGSVHVFGASPSDHTSIRMRTMNSFSRKSTHLSGIMRRCRPWVGGGYNRLQVRHHRR